VVCIGFVVVIICLFTSDVLVLVPHFEGCETDVP
jgi:hypothetical protein